MAIAEDDLTFLAPVERRNPHYRYAARMLLYAKSDLVRILARKRATGRKMLSKHNVQALCKALGVPTATAGHGAKLDHGKWCGSSEISKQQMLVRARLSIDPRGRITHQRNRVEAI